MSPTSVSVNDGFDRFERLLLAMHVGDELRPDDAANQTGLTRDVCREVLLGLERAGLMMREAVGETDRFVRRRLDLSAQSGGSPR
jgi:hypothetical protein